MVRVYPFNSFASANNDIQTQQNDSCSSFSSAPNRSSLNGSYDGSVIIDSDIDEHGKRTFSNTKKETDVELERQTPVVVISKVRSKEKEQDRPSMSICSEQGITFRNVGEFIGAGILEVVQKQSFLIYSQETRAGGGHNQVGICAALAVEDCLKGCIKRHEKVTKEAACPLRRSSSTPHPRNVDPVMLMYRQSDVIQSITDRIMARDSPVMLQTRSRHGSRLGISGDDHAITSSSDTDDHKIWSVTDEEDIEAIRTAFMLIESLYIADGHHRTAAACRMALQNKGKLGLRAPTHTKYLLGFLYPHTHMRVIPYNRCVSGLGGFTPQEFLHLVSSVFRITEHSSDKRIFGTETEMPFIEKNQIKPTVSCSNQQDDVPEIGANASTPEEAGTCSRSPSPPDSPQKNVVRGLVVSLDSGSDSGSESERDRGSERESEDKVSEENDDTIGMALQNKSKVGLRAPTHTKYLLGFLYPHTHMRVIPYNRCVSGLGGYTPQEFLLLVSLVFRISEHNSDKRIFGTETEMPFIQKNQNQNLRDWNEPTVFCSNQQDDKPDIGEVSESEYVLPEEAGTCSRSPSPPDSPQKSIVRGLVVSLDSGSDSGSESESERGSERESEDNDDVESNRGEEFLTSSTTPRGGNLTGRASQLTDARQGLPDSASSGAAARAFNLELEHRLEIVESKINDVGLQEAVPLTGSRSPRIIRMYFQGRWLDLIPLDAINEREEDPLGSLDIQVLFDRLLRPLLGIECPRTDRRMIYVCGSEGSAGLESRVDNQVASVAFRVDRVTVSDIMRVADAGQLMPPKATCFSPKPLAGLFVRLH